MTARRLGIADRESGIGAGGPRFGVRVVLLILVAAAGGPVLHAQLSADAAELRDRLRERYDIVTLQNGLGLVPRQPDTRVGILQIRDGAVSINGQEVTGRELRERLGSDADLVLRVTYLDEAQQRQLAAGDPASSTAAAPAPAPPVASAVGRPRRQGELVRIGGDVHVEPDVLVEREVVVVMGSAQVDGEVERGVVVVMGSLTLGPTAVVHGDVTVVGGTLNRSPSARIDGTVTNVGGDGVRRGFGNLGTTVRDAFAWRVGGLAATLVRVAFVLLLTLVVVAFGPSMVERIADRTAIDPMRAGLIGFFAELLFVPLLVITVLVLAVSIIGIPLLVLVPFGILLALLVLLVGFTGVAYQVGRMLHGRFGWSGRGAYATVALGVIVIGGLTVLARSAALIGGGLLGVPLAALGYFVEYVAWTVGFGAAILVWLRGRRPELHVPALP